MKKEIIIKVFKRLIKFLDYYNIPYHISCGTLLGYIRDNDLIEWDTDIDIHTYVPYIPIIYSLKEKLLNDYQLYFSRFQKGDKILRVKKNYGVKKVYGLNVPDYNKDRYLWRLSINGTNKYEGHEGHESEENNIKTFRWIDIYGKHWFPLLKKVNFKNIDIFIPSNSEKYLEEYYGNWKLPIKKKNFVRPYSAQPIYACTIMYNSKYAKENIDPQYFYIDEFSCNDFVNVDNFINKYKFLKILMKDTLEKLIEK